MTRPTVLAGALKRPLELLLARGGIAGASLALRRRCIVLAYHNIVPEGGEPAADRSLHLPIARFRAQLDLLVRTHDVVPLPDLLTDPAPGARPRAALTFDDAYRGAVTAGLEELAARGMPATVFVAPGCLGGRSFWWDAVLPPEDGRTAFREHALRHLDGRERRVREHARRSGIPEVEVPAHARTATEEELRRAALRPGVSLGSHSWDHPNLARLDPAELARQLAAPLRWLRERFPERTVPWLAYPYGLFSPAVTRAAAAAGYAAALRVSGGALPLRPADRLALPRLNVPEGLSPEGLLLRTAGLVPVR